MGDFIDAPLRTYSSGMWARLGFAVATDVKPDILIVDEVLSVGDESFQRKSAARMQEFREQGATILLVSHNMATIEAMCKRAAWLDHGELKALGDIDEVIKAYRRSQVNGGFFPITPDQIHSGCSMQFIPSTIPGIVYIHPPSLVSTRFLWRPTRSSIFAEAGIPTHYVQDTIRDHAGHPARFALQIPNASKQFRVVAGEVYDVAVDLRRGSPTFGKWVGEYLSADNKMQVWVPEGFAHGFYVTSEWAEVIYKTTDFYAPQWERSLLWNDPDLGIEWPLVGGASPLLSAKDMQGKPLREAEVFSI